MKLPASFSRWKPAQRPIIYGPWREEKDPWEREPGEAPAAASQPVSIPCGFCGSLESAYPNQVGEVTERLTRYGCADAGARAGRLPRQPPYADRAFAAIHATSGLARGGRAGMVTVSVWAVRGDTPNGHQVYRANVPPQASEGGAPRAAGRST